ncbi:hypothetical protein PG999_005596 [Apiospora kogelbergensis]|uniref:Uncharacterized protein n=1 Tax=Apiospora kogelbergensis TaxID=1337665 RepID=A0AAW0R2M0_9PEZI
MAHVHRVFFVDEILGIRRTADTELLLKWSKIEMNRADVLQWGDTGFRVHPSIGPAEEDRYVIEWDPTWVARGGAGAGPAERVGALGADPGTRRAEGRELERGYSRNPHHEEVPVLEMQDLIDVAPI